MAPASEKSYHAKPPMLPDVGVLALVPDTWSVVWQVRHQILVRLARYFHVVWVDPPLDWRNSITGKRRPHRQGFTSPPGFRVHPAEAWLTKFYRPSWLAGLTSRVRLERAKSVLARAGCEEILLSLWRPEFADAVRRFPHCRSCYHIDDEYSFSDVEMPLSEQERTLIAHVDQVFVSSPSLHLRKGNINLHTTFVPNGVDYRAYATAHPEPDELAVIPRPRIGYSGVLKRQLDWPLLHRLTELRPGWSFVFVGPTQEDPETQSAVRSLAMRPNVHFLGCKPAYQLPPYPQHFDACIMPYRVNDYTRYVYPLKLHEYLATGRPTVGAPIASLERFADVVTLACGADGWTSALDTALAPEANRAERRAARREVARTHDWEELVRHVARVLAERLGPLYVERLETALRVGDDNGRAESMSSRNMASGWSI
jgi:glycosyltransferase involved in cell wall biosynthesis